MQISMQSSIFYVSDVQVWPVPGRMILYNTQKMKTGGPSSSHKTDFKRGINHMD